MLTPFRRIVKLFINYYSFRDMRENEGEPSEVIAWRGTKSPSVATAQPGKLESVTFLLFALRGQ